MRAQQTAGRREHLNTFLAGHVPHESTGRLTLQEICKEFEFFRIVDMP
jgi:hypothetical protein